ncbi:phosphoribosylamine--glycine ligase, partial [Mycobacterium tuberculosis]|nr:phosphoribosylamine--glycine ligase [Mycobacterium tuberculosis]
ALGADGQVVSSGGRVLGVLGVGADLAEARVQAYERIDAIKLPGSHHRSDIGKAALDGEISI